MMKRRFYFPLTVTAFDRNRYGGINWDDPDERDGEFALTHRSRIEAALEEYMFGDENMAQYLHGRESLKAKIESMVWGFEEADNCLYGMVEVELTESLTNEEEAEVKQFISGQNSDGLGEGFEQQEIKIYEGIMSVSFWHRGDDYRIYTEEEFDALFKSRVKRYNVKVCVPCKNNRWQATIEEKVVEAENLNLVIMRSLTPEQYRAGARIVEINEM